jgi:hypothetical protein
MGSFGKAGSKNSQGTPQDYKKGQLPAKTNPDGTKLYPSDYAVAVTGSPQTTTMLAFIGGPSGDLEEINLSLAAQAFVGLQDFVVPSLSDGVDVLFAAVNLVDWLGNPAPFSPLEDFSFSGGVSSQLPGVLLSNSPIAFDSINGFSTANPFTGTAFVEGEIDGQAAVPEPSTWALVMLGFVSLGFAGYRTSRKGAAVAA